MTLRIFLFRGKTLGETLSRGSNNFDLVRLFASVSVVVSHSYDTNNPTHNIDVVSAFFRKADDLGSLSVYTFFFLSGIFVTQSCANNTNLLRFAVLRFFRVYPGLFVNVVITLIIIGLFYGFPSTLWEFLLDTWTVKYFVDNALRFGGVAVSDPAAFPHAKLAGAVNYPLWTLPVEVQCYCMVGIFGALGALRCRALFSAALLVAALAYFAIVWTTPRWPFVIFFFYKFEDYSVYPVAFFMTGMAFYMFRDAIRLRLDLALALIIAFFCLHRTPLHVAALCAALVYAVLTLPNLPWAFRFKPRNDYSYGIDIYGFFCQQMISSSFPAMGSYTSLLVVLPMALIFAALSWHLVEKPCIRLGRALSAPLVQAGNHARPGR